MKQERKAQLEIIEREKRECEDTFSRPECEKECPQYDEFDDTCEQDQVLLYGTRIGFCGQVDTDRFNVGTQLYQKPGERV